MPFSNQEIAHHIWQAVRVLVFAAFVTLILSAGNVYLTVHRSRTLDDIQVQTNKVQDQVNELKQFVDEIKARPSSGTNQAVAEAVNKLIPEIHNVLCQVYPEQCARASRP